MNGIRKIPLAVALALGAGQAWALGLGAVEVRSALNEPLVAEILLTSADAEEIASLKVQLASPEDFERIGLRRSQVTVPLEFAVGRNDRGQPVIKMTSRAPVRDPFLSVLVDAQWTGGRMLREYTMLLDPPLTAPSVRGTVAAAPARVAEPARPRVEALPDETPPAERPAAPPRPVTEPSRPAAEPAPEPARPAAPAFAGAEYGPVAEGETLWLIASNTRPDSAVSVNQMMMALLQANPEAFIGNNINRLRRGAVLRIPEATEVRSLSAADANQFVARQHEQWRDSRGERALPRIEPSESVAARPTPSRTEPARPVDDRLAIVPPGDQRRPDAGETRPGVSADSVEVEGLRADLSRSRESLSAAEQEVRELRGRVSELERLQGSQDRLLSLKDAELADLQRRLAELQAARGMDPAADEGLPTDFGMPDAEETLADEPAVEPATESADPFVLIDPPRETVEPQRPSAEERAAAREAEAPPPAVPARLAPEPQPSWYTSPYLLGALAVLMAVVLALVARRRRGSSAESAGSGSLAKRLVAASATSGGGVAAQAAGDGELAALQEAVNQDPTDLAAHLALLRYRFDAGDAEGFEADAETMSGFVSDTAAPEWDEVRMMGAEIAPGHPLFRDPGASVALDAEPDFAGEFDFGEDEVESQSEVERSDVQPAPEPYPAEPESFAIDLDGGTIDFPGSDEGVPESDFQPTFEPGPADDDQAQPAAADDYSTQQFASVDIANALDAGAGGDQDLSLDGESDDAVSTKLDLAREYLDLGDPEGARSLLEEVLKEGSSAQKAEAQRLMVQIR
jgi:pilus assembly protein FimV